MTTSTTPRGLYHPDDVMALLPAAHRAADAEAGGALRELVEVITGELNVLAESVDQLLDDQFIETAAPWVTAYLGDLVGYRTLHSDVPTVASPRAEVANTIRHRRRKGTASVLEDLARDVTGWPARVVECFELLATSQFMNHVRPHAPATADLRGGARLEVATHGFQAGAFADAARTADVRRIATGEGRFNIPNIAFFLWRIHPVRLARTPLVAADGSQLRWRIDPLGVDQPLFAMLRTEADTARRATIDDLPIPLPRRWLATRFAHHWGADSSLLLELDDSTDVVALPGGLVHVCNLADDPDNPGAWLHQPAPGSGDVAIDPVLGRVAVGDPPAAGTRLLATVHHGSALLLGGHGGDRAAHLTGGIPEVEVTGGGSLVAALNAVAEGGMVAIRDNEHWTLPGTLTVATPADGSPPSPVVVRADNRTRPLVRRAADQCRLIMDPDTTVVLDGLVVAGAPLVLDEVADGSVRTIVLRNCTLVPGLDRSPDNLPLSPDAASLVVLHPLAEVVLERCTVGPIVAVEDTRLTLVDTVVDAGARDAVAICGRDEPAGGGLRVVGGAADRLTGDGLAPAGTVAMEACTVVGTVHATRLDVSNSLLLARRTDAADPRPAPVLAQRRQVGCMRFSWVPPGSRTPRRHRCVPADDEGGRPVPHHTSLRTGDPAAMQLRVQTDDRIRRGADDGGEMGAGHHLHQPQREANLHIRLDEYLRFGLQAGLFFAT